MCPPHALGRFSVFNRICPATRYADQDGLEFAEICLQNAGVKGVCHTFDLNKLYGETWEGAKVKKWLIEVSS